MNAVISNFFLLILILHKLIMSLLALEYVEEDKVYILGGLVDETIQKVRLMLEDLLMRDFIVKKRLNSTRSHCFL